MDSTHDAEILIVEDTISDQEMFEQLLESSGYKLKFAYHGLRGELWSLDKIRAEIRTKRYECVLLDLALNDKEDRAPAVRLSQLDADEILRKIEDDDPDYRVSGVQLLREEGRSGNTVFVVTSAYVEGTERLAQVCRQLGAYRVFRKWEDRETLIDYIDDAIHRAREMRERDNVGPRIEEKAAKYINALLQSSGDVLQRFLRYAPPDADVGFFIGREFYVASLTGFLDEVFRTREDERLVNYQPIGPSGTWDQSLIDASDNNDLPSGQPVVVLYPPLCRIWKISRATTREDKLSAQQRLLAELRGALKRLRPNTKVVVFMPEENKPYKALSGFAYHQDLVDDFKRGWIVVVPIVGREDSEADRASVIPYPEPPTISVNQAVTGGLEDDLLELVQDTYTGFRYRKIQVDREIGVGRSGARILVVIPFLEREPDGMLVEVDKEIIKTGPMDLIQKENANYEHVMDTISAHAPHLRIPHVETLPEYQKAALRLTFVGGETLRKLLQDGRLAEVQEDHKVIEELFGPDILGKMYQQRGFRRTGKIGDLYRQKLHPAFTIEVDELNGASVVGGRYLDHLSTGPVTSQPVAFQGKVLRVDRHRRTVDVGTETHTDGGRVEDRVRLRFPQSIHYPGDLAVNQRVDVSGKLTGTRRTHYSGVFRELFNSSQTDTVQESFPLSMILDSFKRSGLLRCNPLLFHESLLGKTVPDLMRSLIVGDLNLNNILVSERRSDCRIWLIDFARMEERGHVFFDLAELESDLRIRFLDERLYGRLNLRDVVALEATLMLDWFPELSNVQDLLDDTRLPSRLESLVAWIRAVRTQVPAISELVARSREINALRHEYLAAVFFASIMTADLSDPTVSAQAKQAALVSAAFDCIPLVRYFSLEASVHE